MTTKKEINLKDSAVQDVIKIMQTFAENYAKSTNTFFCSDLEITEAVIIGLAKNKIESGAALCPCRCYIDKNEEASFSFWNCPCVPMRERKECHCMLFLQQDNSFASQHQEITISALKS